MRQAHITLAFSPSALEKLKMVIHYSYVASLACCSSMLNSGAWDASFRVLLKSQV